MTESFYLPYIANAVGVRQDQVKKTLELLQGGATIPFIARYRKEVTSHLDEVQIGEIQKKYQKLEELVSRKQTVLEAIESQGKLTPELRDRIEKCMDPIELEDIYLPYKKKRKTRADIAREKGLDGLAQLILQQREKNILGAAKIFINELVPNEEEALQGARDIIAETVNEEESCRDYLRNVFRKHGIISSKVVKTKAEEAVVYKDYFEFSEPVQRCPSHRYLAMMRGEQEGMLRVFIDIDEERAVAWLERKFIFTRGDAADQISLAIADGYKRLMVPSIENQIRTEYKEKADEEAIKVFSENLRQLLLAAPLGQKSILALDPGFRTGCKLVCLNERGDLIHNSTIYPHPPQNQWSESQAAIRALVDRYDVDSIAIGNGTASRESRDLVEGIRFDRQVKIFVVSENGASIYSASEAAREEFPDKDVTVRGAISIGRRLMDPLAELVKIDPKSIGVGQYQHDVDQIRLKESLDMTVMSCVNSVGINLNTASKHLLMYVSGLGPTLSQNIVKFREEKGGFTSRNQLKEVPRLGEKAYEQCAGFLRIKDAHDPLDNTAVHPESYGVVAKMASDMGVTVKQLIEDPVLRKKIELSRYVTEKTGLPTLQDILKELEKPGLDPRGEARAFAFDATVKTIEDVRAGMLLPGIVTNLTAFGAFVDIGVKQDGLLHISQITRKFIKSPAEVLKLHQELNVKVIEVDVARKRINLSLL
ncbi:MAG: RNA-binding transcriptional accessory protein [Saprospiraceae bacterium]|nr:RNA-binding transcriptional accessory protein [Saprospiraceae bacterium]